MGNPISPLGWVLIIFLVVFIVGINVSMFMGIKNRRNKGGWINKLRDTGQTLKDPFHEENQKIEELSEKIAQLQKVRQRKMEESEETNKVGDKK